MSAFTFKFLEGFGVDGNQTKPKKGVKITAVSLVPLKIDEKLPVFWEMIKTKLMPLRVVYSVFVCVWERKCPLKTDYILIGSTWGFAKASSIPDQSN